MVRRGLLKTNGDGKPQIKVRLPDGTERRVYHVLPEIFADGEGASVEAKVEPSEPKRNPQAK